jgi:hypothetical protein
MVLAGLVSAFGASPLLGQGGSAAIRGRIIDATTRLPIAGVVVQVGGAGVFAESDSTGAFRFGGLQPQLARIRIFHPGYALVERSLNLYPRRTVPIEYALVPEIQRLADVRVEAAVPLSPTAMMLEGFTERRRTGFGTFFDETDLTRWEHRLISDVLRGVSSVKAIGDMSNVYVATNRLAVRSMVRDLGPCFLDIIIDGNLIYSQSSLAGGASQPPPNINALITVTELAGVEIYGGVSDIPAKYRSAGNMCGAILFWTRRGWGPLGEKGEVRRGGEVYQAPPRKPKPPGGAGDL